MVDDSMYEGLAAQMFYSPTAAPDAVAFAIHGAFQPSGTVAEVEEGRRFALQAEVSPHCTCIIS